MTLEHLWAGWRNEYVARASVANRPGGSLSDDGGCVFCRILESGPPSAENGIVWRDDLACALLNAYPYTTAHLLVMPVRHLGELSELSAAESTAVWETARTAVEVLTAAYDPDGANIGANLGRAAGAGIPGHLHLHVLPRWSGDTNFMTAVAGVRVMPEPLEETWAKVHTAWSGD
jgi:diadenosine tetraphosphate (Ap4A) HIT family hydrolase